LILFAVVYSGVHILTWTLIRYRLPVDGVLIPFAALALVSIAERIPGLKSSLKSLGQSQAGLSGK
jgi:hypothetical protein